MPKRDQDYHLIAALHDQLEDIESYERYLKDAGECAECAQLWTMLKDRAEEAVAMIRKEVQSHVGS